MAENRRKTRPPVERTQPDRTWSGPGAQPGAGSEGSAAANPQPDAKQSAYEAVNTAYRIIDESLRQGQRLAEGVWLPLTDSGNAANGAFAAPERFMRAMGDMTVAWAEVMQQWSRGVQNSEAEPGAAKGSAGPFDAGKPKAANGSHARARTQASASASAVAVVLTIVASGRVEASVYLQPGADATALTMGKLRSATDDAVVLCDVVLSAEDPATLCVRVEVPDDQPKGAYTAVLLERVTLRPQGTLSVRVS